MAKDSIKERIKTGELVRRMIVPLVIDGDGVKNCPLYGREVLIDGTCLDLHLNSKEKGKIRITGRPDNITYDVYKKCGYAGSVNRERNTHKLVEVLCADPE